MILLNSPTVAQNWDWHISSGTIIDGTGSPAYSADILVRGDSIGFIGKVDPDTIAVSHTVDASGKVVSPGFIDPHAHGNPLKTPEFRNFLAMGVTTIVLGQDGSSPDPGNLSDWFERVSDSKPAVNIASLSGHGSIRQKIGVGNQPPSAQDLQRMKKLLQADLNAGAFGMSTGLEYVPGLYAGEHELQQLAGVVGKHDGIIMSHMRSEDNSKIMRSLDELAAQGKHARVHASHLKVVYGESRARAEEILNYIHNFRKERIEITADVYPYSASYTGIGIVFPEWAKTERGWKNARRERPAALRSFLESKLEQRNGPGAILFGSGEYSGMTLKEAAERKNKNPVDLLMEIGPQAASAAHFVMDRDLQDHMVLGKKVMISSDGSPTMHHPRGYGSFAKIIRYYVKENDMLKLEEAIYKMSGLPAQTLKLKKRGTVKVGKKADLLVFDPGKITDRASFEHPHKLARGFNWIMVNGQPVRENGRFYNVSRGKVLRRSME